jgi:mono/diheme cytochrome c family protein
MSARVPAALLSLCALGAQAQEPQSGKQVFDLWCAGCHKPLGPYVSSVAGTSVLERKYKDSKPAALEERTDLTPALIKLYVRHGVKFMPFFRKTEISDAQLDALATYLSKGR